MDFRSVVELLFSSAGPGAGGWDHTQMHVCVEEGEPSLATPAVHPGEGHREAPDSRAGPPGCQQGAPADRQAGAGSDRCVPIFQVRSVLQPGGLLPLQHVQPALLPGWGGELGGGGAQVCSGVLRRACLQASRTLLQTFLAESDGRRVAVVADPPFGGLVEALANTFSLISHLWRRTQDSGGCFGSAPSSARG